MSNSSNRSLSLLQLVLEVAAAAAIILHVLLLSRAWLTLPDTIPVHFGISGQPDKWGQKAELLVLPVLGLLLYVGLTWISRYAHKFNYPWEVTQQNAERQYRLARLLLGAIKVHTVWLFTIITWKSVRVAMGHAEGFGAAFVPAVLAVPTLIIITYFVLASRSS